MSVRLALTGTQEVFQPLYNAQSTGQLKFRAPVLSKFPIGQDHQYLAFFFGKEPINSPIPINGGHYEAAGLVEAAVAFNASADGRTPVVTGDWMGTRSVVEDFFIGLSRALPGKRDIALAIDQWTVPIKNPYEGLPRHIKGRHLVSQKVQMRKTLPSEQLITEPRAIYAHLLNHYAELRGRS